VEFLTSTQFDSGCYMGQRLNDLLSTLHLFHLLEKDHDPSSKPTQPIKPQNAPKSPKRTITLSPSSGRNAAFRSPQCRARRGRQPPLQFLHLYRPIHLQQLPPDPRPIRTCQLSPIRSPRTPPSPLAPFSPPGTLFLRAVHRSPPLQQRTFPFVRVTRAVSEVKSEQQAKERRFEAILADVKTEFRLAEVQ